MDLRRVFDTDSNFDCLESVPPEIKSDRSRINRSPDPTFHNDQIQTGWHSFFDPMLSEHFQTTDANFVGKHNPAVRWLEFSNTHRTVPT